jgi:hypothetical protein
VIQRRRALLRIPRRSAGAHGSDTGRLLLPGCDCHRGSVGAFEVSGCHNFKDAHIVLGCAHSGADCPNFKKARLSHSAVTTHLDALNTQKDTKHTAKLCPAALISNIQNRDLLICNNNHEQHGNLGPIVGDRYSVVAFLHNSVIGRAPIAD